MITPERNERFWKACGFKVAKTQTVIWPDGAIGQTLPESDDLNALFRWAVPKVSDKYKVTIQTLPGHYLATVSAFLPGEITRVYNAEAVTPGEALFLACEKALAWR